MEQKGLVDRIFIMDLRTALDLALPDTRSRPGDEWPLRDYGPLLKSLRLRKRLRQWEVARLAGTRQSFVSKAERGKDIKVSTLLALAEALGFEVTIRPREKS